MMDSMAEHIVDGLKFLENNTAPGQQQYTWKDRVYLGDIKPSTVTRGTSLGYCYGDLGIANTFIYAATCFGNDHYNKIGMTASENLIPRILDFEIKHDDLLWFCHGIAGLIYFANMFRHISPHAKEWDGVLDELLNKIYNYVSSKNQLPPGMLNGVNGVILSLLSIIKSTFIGRTLLLN